MPSSDAIRGWLVLLVVVIPIALVWVVLQGLWNLFWTIWNDVSYRTAALASGHFGDAFFSLPYVGWWWSAYPIGSSLAGAAICLVVGSAVSGNGSGRNALAGVFSLAMFAMLGRVVYRLVVG